VSVTEKKSFFFKDLHQVNNFWLEPVAVSAELILKAVDVHGSVVAFGSALRGVVAFSGRLGSVVIARSSGRFWRIVALNWGFRGFGLKGVIVNGNSGGLRSVVALGSGSANVFNNRLRSVVRAGGLVSML
jgi:hypothetical protein